jgi:hypothetical protein
MSAPDSAQTPPQAQLMQMAMGFMVPLLLRAAAQSCLADHPADGPKTAAELAVATNAHVPAMAGHCIENIGEEDLVFSNSLPSPTLKRSL